MGSDMLTCKTGNYFIINQILNKGLHTESDECMAYTTTLMDRLEKFKNEHVGNDTVHDDVAAQAFVEQFALDTFNRADTAIRTNKATAWVLSNCWTGL
jgi:vacuolar protein sorting-associated protein VTA1